MPSKAIKKLALLTAFCCPCLGTVMGQDLTVMSSGGFAAPFTLLVPRFEASTGMHVTSIHGASMGTAPTAIPMRLARHEPADVVIMARSELDALVRKGLVVEGSQVDLVRSSIGLAVRAGTPIPDIGTVAAFTKTLLEASSIVYSDSASGAYISSEMYKRMDLEKELAPKSRRIVGEPVGEVVAHGDAAVGFQQMSELKAVSGITVVGPIPASLQKITVFSAGIVIDSRRAEAAHALIDFLASPSACLLMLQTSLEPIACAPGEAPAR